MPISQGFVGISVKALDAHTWENHVLEGIKTGELGAFKILKRVWRRSHGSFGQAGGRSSRILQNAVAACFGLL